MNVWEVLCHDLSAGCPSVSIKALIIKHQANIVRVFNSDDTKCKTLQADYVFAVNLQ